MAVPVGFEVSTSGEVVLPGPDLGAYSAPAFDGPWGTATTAFFTATNTDGGGVSCGNTTARTILRASWLPLVDRSTSHDYWGVDLAAVAEVTGTSRCNDYLDGARIGFRSTTTGAAVVAEDPVSGRTQACATRRVTVGASWGGVSGSVAQDFTHCERIGSPLDGSTTVCVPCPPYGFVPSSRSPAEPATSRVPGRPSRLPWLAPKGRS